MHVQFFGRVTKAKMPIIIISKYEGNTAKGTVQTTRVQCTATKYARKPIIRKCLTELIRK